MDRKAKAIIVFTLTSGAYSISYFHVSFHHMFCTSTKYTHHIFQYVRGNIFSSLSASEHSIHYDVSVFILKRLNCREQHQNRRWNAIIDEEWCTFHIFSINFINITHTHTYISERARLCIFGCVRFGSKSTYKRSNSQTRAHTHIRKLYVYLIPHNFKWHIGENIAMCMKSTIWWKCLFIGFACRKLLYQHFYTSLMSSDR